MNNHRRGNEDSQAEDVRGVQVLRGLTAPAAFTDRFKLQEMPFEFTYLK